MSGARLQAHDLSLGYGDRRVVEGLDLEVPDGSFTVIVGANGSGKSTLLRGLARMLPPTSGEVTLDGVPLRSRPTKELARQLGLLPQGPVAPDGIDVADLVGRGRFPHQGILRQWTTADAAAVDEALRVTGTADLAGRRVDELSGGQRQRVWLALVLAQETPILLLDEPTTFLDIAHQLEVLELCETLRREHGRTLVAVLHDIDQACRYATHLVAMRDGRIVARGSPGDIVDASLIEAAFGLHCRVIPDPETGTPLVVPLRPVR